MARTNTLTNFLTDVATAIKQKTGNNTSIPASEFDTEILSITTSGTYQAKSVNIADNGSYNLNPDQGYDAMSTVTINVAVSPNLQNLTVIQNGVYSAGQNYDGIGEVTVDVDNQITLDIIDGVVSGNTLILDGKPYTELEYIQSTGTQYINPNIQLQNTDIVELQTSDVYWSNLAADDATLFNGSGVWSAGAYLLAAFSNGIWWCAGSNIKLTNVTNNKDIIKIQGTGVIVNGQVVRGVGTYSSTMSNLTLMNTNGGYYGKFKLHYFKISNSSMVLQHEFIDEICLYDKVTKQFFTNSGTGSFVAGPEKL